LSIIPVDALINPESCSFDLAKHVSKYHAAVQSIQEWLTSYDMNLPLIVLDHFDADSGAASSSGLNLLQYHERFTLEHIFDWQFYFNSFCQDVDLESSYWTVDYLLKCFSSDLKDEVLTDYYDLDQELRGSAVLLKLALHKVMSNSHENRQALQGVIVHFKLSEVPGENVSNASKWLKSVMRTLAISNDVPSRSVQYILTGMSSSSDDTFNSMCTMLSLQHRSSSYASSQTNSSLILKTTTTILKDLVTFYHDAFQARRWPGALTQAKSSALTASSLHQSIPRTPSQSALTSSDLVALLSQLNANKNFGGKRCYNCNADDHLVADCPKANPVHQNRGRSPGRSGRNDSRGRSFSRSQSRGRDRSRDPSRSRDSKPASRRNDTPGRPRSASREKSVAFSQPESRAFTASTSNNNEYTSVAANLLERLQLTGIQLRSQI
jgi:hypothetical protein